MSRPLGPGHDRDRVQVRTPGWGVPTELRENGPMGKVKDEVSASKASKPPKGKAGGGPPRMILQFFTNLLQAGLYKPMQGWYARIYTALGLGVIAAAGVWR